MSPLRASGRGFQQPATIWRPGRDTRALIQRGQHEEARRVLDAIVARSPGNCEARALIAGDLALTRSSNAATAAAAVSSVLHADDGAGALIRCGVVVGAVRGDAALAADYIERMSSHIGPIQSDDGHLTDDLASFGSRRGWYPWNQVADDPRVIEALHHLDEARLEIRSRLAARLPQLPSLRRTH